MAGSKASQSIFREAKCCNPPKRAYNYKIGFVRITQGGGTQMKTALKIVACIAAVAALGFGVWKLVELVKN